MSADAKSSFCNGGKPLQIHTFLWLSLHSQDLEISYADFVKQQPGRAGYRVKQEQEWISRNLAQALYLSPVVSR